MHLIRSFNNLDEYFSRREYYIGRNTMCVDGGLICIPIAVKLASVFGLGGVATAIWHKCRKGKATQ